MLQNGNEIERSAPSNEREVKVASVAQSQIAVDQLVAEVVVRLFPTSVLNGDPEKTRYDFQIRLTPVVDNKLTEATVVLQQGTLSDIKQNKHLVAQNILLPRVLLGDGICLVEVTGEIVGLSLTRTTESILIVFDPDVELPEDVEKTERVEVRDDDLVGIIPIGVIERDESPEKIMADLKTVIKNSIDRLFEQKRSSKYGTYDVIVTEYETGAVLIGFQVGTGFASLFHRRFRKVVPYIDESRLLDVLAQHLGKTEGLSSSKRSLLVEVKPGSIFSPNTFTSL